MKFKVKTAGERVDSFLAKESGLSRSALEKLFAAHQVQVNGRAAKKSQRVEVGDEVTAASPKKESVHLKAEDLPLDILFEDKELLVVNKPAGMVVHPDSTGHHSGTLVNAVLSHLKIKAGKDLRPGIVHRLDKDTSGALVVAKTPASLTRLSKLFLERDVHKTYLALVKGTPRTETGRIDAAIRRSSSRRQEMAIHSQGRRAVTTFEVLATWGWCSLLKVNIETGRTHQIRLHLASIGHPILGDAVYGEKAANAAALSKLKLTRQWLHAWKLELDGHKFTAPLPEELSQALPTAILL